MFDKKIVQLRNLQRYHALIRVMLTVVVCATLFSFQQKKEGIHLFILSGQSNMVGLRPEESFRPALEKEFGKDRVLIVKHAMGSQPISRWYKQWKPSNGEAPAGNGDLYDSLLNKVRAAVQDQPVTITFVWMQGERDARLKFGDVYEASLLGLYQQLSIDLQRTDINFIIGRLSDFGMQNEQYPHWQMIRDVQVKVGSSNPRFGWIDTDDLNDGTNREGKAITNDLHMSAQGYITMGYRFAEKAIELISKKP